MAMLVRRRDLSAPPIQRWQPFPELQELQEQMAQLMERMVSGEDGGPWVPAVDIEEADDGWIVEAEVPGAKRDDVDVEVRDSEIAITGEIKDREREGVMRRRTRRSGRFEFRVTLPGPTDPEKVQADLDDGLLRLRIPKPEIARPRHVEVRSGTGQQNGTAGPADPGAAAEAAIGAAAQAREAQTGQGARTGQSPSSAAPAQPSGSTQTTGSASSTDPAQQR